jgi:predicted GNAT family N-acyltransferase
VMDAQCLHAVAYDEENQAIGTGRLLPDGHIGRMAVLESARNSGVGAQIPYPDGAGKTARRYRRATECTTDS